MFDNHIWGVTADNESISANLFISGFFKSLMLVSASAPKTAYQLCKLLQLGFLIVLCSRTLNLLKPRKQSLHHSCRFRHLMWCWSNVLLLFCHRRFVSSHVNSLARLQNYPKTRIGIVTEMLAHVSSSFFFFFFFGQSRLWTFQVLLLNWWGWVSWWDFLNWILHGRSGSVNLFTIGNSTH